MAKKTTKTTKQDKSKQKIAEKKSLIASIMQTIGNLTGDERKKERARLNRLKADVKKKVYKFKGTINGVEYETSTSPKEHARLKKLQKDAEKMAKDVKSLQNGFDALSEKEKLKAKKEIERTNKKLLKKKSSVLKTIRKKSHSASTTNKFGVKTTIKSEIKRKSGKPKDNVTYYIVFKIVDEMSILANTNTYEFSDGAFYTAIEDGKKGDSDFYDIITRRFGGNVAEVAEIVSIRTEDKIKSQVKTKKK
jgi:hypothetical protein